MNEKKKSLEIDEQLHIEAFLPIFKINPEFGDFHLLHRVPLYISTRDNAEDLMKVIKSIFLIGLKNAHTHSDLFESSLINKFDKKFKISSKKFSEQMKIDFDIFEVQRDIILGRLIVVGDMAIGFPKGNIAIDPNVFKAKIKYKDMLEVSGIVIDAEDVEIENHIISNTMLFSEKSTLLRMSELNFFNYLKDISGLQSNNALGYSMEIKFRERSCFH